LPHHPQASVAAEEHDLSRGVQQHRVADLDIGMRNPLDQAACRFPLGPDRPLRDEQFMLEAAKGRFRRAKPLAGVFDFSLLKIGARPVDRLPVGPPGFGGAGLVGSRPGRQHEQRAQQIQHSMDRQDKVSHGPEEAIGHRKRSEE
jgi:hypothetical protein